MWRRCPVSQMPLHHHRQQQQPHQPVVVFPLVPSSSPWSRKRWERMRLQSLNPRRRRHPRRNRACNRRRNPPGSSPLMCLSQIFNQHQCTGLEGDIELVNIVSRVFYRKYDVRQVSTTFCYVTAFCFAFIFSIGHVVELVLEHVQRVETLVILIQFED